jgi:hypothetical protein
MEDGSTWAASGLQNLLMRPTTGTAGTVSRPVPLQEQEGKRARGRRRRRDSSVESSQQSSTSEGEAYRKALYSYIKAHDAINTIFLEAWSFDIDVVSMLSHRHNSSCSNNDQDPETQPKVYAKI